ncbi:MAG TPA: ABC transporter permease [Solirubrobacteraceae bacterium]|nr:ABC transporter permease [Solirubrobacteraceae bacterium]
MLAVAKVVIPSFSSGGGGANSCVRDNHLFCADWVSRNWSGVLQPALTQHIALTLIAISIGSAISLVLSLAAHRRGWLERPVIIVTGILFTIPSLALFQILVPSLGLTRANAEVALVSYTLLILFRNTLTGLREIPEEVREAARGMGMSQRQLLWRVELPLALPAIMAGLRIATVTVISLATVAAYVCNEGLGVPIFAGIQESVFKTEIIAAGALAIMLALASDALLVGIQRLLTPWARKHAV